MAQTLEIIKEDGKSIRIGTTGTIGSLMTRELESVKSVSQVPTISPRNKAPMVAVSVPCSTSAPKKLQPRTSSDEASSSKSVNHRSPETARKTKNYTRKGHKIPMLGADNISLDRTPCRQKTEKKGSVEIVDIKCGNTDRAWSSPITNRLKKLGFSKLSESMI